jgi:hypothetical protein
MEPMETKSFKPYFVVIGLMVATSLLLAFTVNVKVSDEAGVRMFLPDQVGQWHGEDILYCQNAACQKDFNGGEIKGSDVCPACGGKLSSMSKAERDMLPSDTGLVRKRYASSDGRVVYVSIVLSGKERGSIHRPQMCLVGQGQEIVRSVTIPVPMNGRKPLDVMSLELLRRYKTAEGQPREYASYYSYWFVGKGRETSSHIQRMIWMATDRIFHNVSHRWAYIAVAGTRDKNSEDYQEEMASFIHDLYPEVRMN